MQNNVLVCLMFGWLVSFAQFESQLPQTKKYDAKEVADSTYGITMYRKLNMWQSPDSVRLDKKGYPCQGWVEDFYESGKLLHKGFYVDGFVRNFENYYENQVLERKYTANDVDQKANLKTYYITGKLKSEINYFNRQPVQMNLFDAQEKPVSEVHYVNKNPVVWKDFYENGFVQMETIYDDAFVKIKKRGTYYANGKPENIIELKSDSIYNGKIYLEDGKLRTEGTYVFKKQFNDFFKEGEWLVYVDGKLTFREYYKKGKLAGRNSASQMNKRSGF